MVGGVLAASTNGRQYEGKVTSFMLVTCLVAAMGGLLFGYKLGITGGVVSMEPFLAKFFSDDTRMKDELRKDGQYLKYDYVYYLSFTFPFYFAAIMNAFKASTNTRMFGRKATMHEGGIIFLVGSLLNGLAFNSFMLFIGQMMLGMGVGFCNQVRKSIILMLSFFFMYKMSRIARLNALFFFYS
jgi:MFS transporter, SP family, sugar:H+ symporter